MHSQTGGMSLSIFWKAMKTRKAKPSNHLKIGVRSLQIGPTATATVSTLPRRPKWGSSMSRDLHSTSRVFEVRDLGGL